MKCLIQLLKMKKLKREVNQLQKYDELIDLGYKWHLDKNKVDLYELKKRKCILQCVP